MTPHYPAAVEGAAKALCYAEHKASEVVGNAVARRPEQVRSEIATNPEKRELLQQATQELLGHVERFIRRYVVVDDTCVTAVALWVLHTWTLDAADATPYLVILSTEPGSGKTRLLEVLSYLVRKPWHTANTTPTALFRRMSEEKPTLLLDELDAIFRGGSSYEALRQVLDAGNRRGATVTRCDGKWGVREYDTFGPKAMAGIDNGFIPATLLDRSIVIRMGKRSGEPVERLRYKVAAGEAAPLRYTLEQWAGVAVDELAAENPELPATLSDRSCDAWEPLLAIGQFGKREDETRQAMSTLAAPMHEKTAPALLAGMMAVMS